MNHPSRLLGRLEAIAAALQQSEQALALIGLGSVGLETDRLDACSDLDFFVIVQPGAKQRYLESLDWLAAAGPLVYAFRNTSDGYKALYEDDIFCEFAVFEEAELANIPFAPGRIVWRQSSVPESIAQPGQGVRHAAQRTQEWLLGEALTNVYIGLGRYNRGEQLSALRLIQVEAVNRIIELSPLLEQPTTASRDPFAPERRYEQQFPGLARQLPAFMQGYTSTPRSALAILAFLEAHFEVNPAIAGRIRERAEQGLAQGS